MVALLVLARCNCPTQRARRSSGRASRQQATVQHSREPAGGHAPADGRARLLWIASAQLGRQPVVVLLPGGYDAKRVRPYRLLIAFSGRGEAVLDPERGAWGWVRDYQLGRLVRRLERGGPLRAADFGGLVRPARLDRINRSLAQRPYRGMVVACPHTFDLLGAGSLRNAAYERFYLQELPRALARQLRLDPAARPALDGVSLGGLWALMLGLAHPGQVSQVQALQPAVTPFVSPLLQLARLHRGALSQLPLSLVTSSGDGLRPAVTALSGALRAAGVEHQLTLLLGPHDYAFNRGPGGMQLLLWHDRRFQGLTL